MSQFLHTRRCGRLYFKVLHPGRKQLLRSQLSSSLRFVLPARMPEVFAAHNSHRKIRGFSHPLYSGSRRRGMTHQLYFLLHPVDSNLLAISKTHSQFEKTQLFQRKNTYSQPPEPHNSLVRHDVVKVFLPSGNKTPTIKTRHLVTQLQPASPSASPPAACSPSPHHPQAHPHLPPRINGTEERFIQG